MIEKVSHAGISVYDMDESIKWYHKNLGFNLKRDTYIEELHSRVVFLENYGFELELFEYDNPQKLPDDRLIPNIDLQTIGTKHIAFTTTDINTLKQYFTTNDVDIAHEVNMNNNKVMFIRDCNGVLIEFIEYQ